MPRGRRRGLRVPASHGSPTVVAAYMVFLVLLAAYTYWMVSEDGRLRSSAAGPKPALERNGGLANGYLPFKPIEATMAVRNLPRDYDEGTPDTSDMECPSGRASCRGLGHPEICCVEDHICLPTNNSITGVYCCPYTNGTDGHCTDTTLSCSDGTYECPASVNGGCCPYSFRCALTQCVSGGGPTSPFSAPPTSSSTFELRSTLPYTPGFDDDDDASQSDAWRTAAPSTTDATIPTADMDSRVVNSLTSTGVVDAPRNGESNGTALTRTEAPMATTTTTSGATVVTPPRDWCFGLAWWVVVLVMAGLVGQLLAGADEMPVLAGGP